MKKVLMILIVFVAAYFAFDFYNKHNFNDVIELDTGESVILKPEFDLVFDASAHLHKKGEIDATCNNESEIICAVETTVKCSVDPTLSICSKNIVPDYTFMEDDEFLGRPTEVLYRITGIKTIDADTIEVRTKSECNGSWFGLCQGNVIYVVDNVKGFFRVKDVYALGE